MRYWSGFSPEKDVRMCTCVWLRYIVAEQTDDVRKPKKKEKGETIVDKCVCCFTKHFRFNRVLPSGFFSCSCLLLHSSLLVNGSGLFFWRSPPGASTAREILSNSRHDELPGHVVKFIFFFLRREKQQQMEWKKWKKTSRRETKAKCRMLRFSPTALPTHQLEQWAYICICIYLRSTYDSLACCY